MLERFNRWIRNLTGFKVQRTFKYFVMKQKNVHTAWVQGEKWRVQQKCGGSFWNATADWLFFSECFRVDQSEDALQLVGLRHAWGPWFCSKRLRRFSLQLQTFYKNNSWIFSCWTESGNFQKQLIEQWISAAAMSQHGLNVEVQVLNNKIINKVV